MCVRRVWNEHKSWYLSNNDTSRFKPIYRVFYLLLLVVFFSTKIIYSQLHRSYHDTNLAALWAAVKESRWFGLYEYRLKDEVHLEVVVIDTWLSRFLIQFTAIFWKYNCYSFFYIPWVSFKLLFIFCTILSIIAIKSKEFTLHHFLTYFLVLNFPVVFPSTLI